MRVPRLLAAGLLLIALGLGGRRLVLHLLASDVVVGTVTVGLDASAVAVDELTGRVVVSNTSDGTVSVLDASSGAVHSSVTVAGNPNQVAVDERTGRAFILNDATNVVSVLDVATGGIVATVHCTVVRDLAIDARRGRVLVVGLLADGSSGVYVLDAHSGRIVHTILTPLESWGVAVDALSGHVLVTNRGDGSVSLLDVAAGRIIRTVQVGMHPSGVEVAARLGLAFAVNNGDSSGARGGTITMLDARQGTVLRSIGVRRDPAAVVVDARTSRLFVTYGLGGGKGPGADSGSGSTDVLDARSGRLVRTVPAGALPDDDLGTALYPHMVAVDERRGRIYVVNRAALDRTGRATAGSVSVLDAVSGRVLRTIAVGRSPVALAVDETAGRLFVVNRDGAGPRGVSQTVGGWVPSWLRPWLPFLPTPLPPVRGPNAASTVTVIDTANL